MKPKPTTWGPATLSEFDGVRFLHLDSIWVQGAMRIRKPDQLELEYIQRMCAWMLWRDPVALGEGHAVQLGLGAAALTRFCHGQLKMRTTAVEINPEVIAACRQWFRLPGNDARLSVVNGDAAAWVNDDANLQTVDVLNVDLYDHDAASPVLDDEAFYAACRGVLADGGLMTVNLFGRSASFARSALRIAKAFGSDQVWSLAPTKEGNTVVVAARGVQVPHRDILEQRAANIESRFKLPARKWLRLVRPLPMSILNAL
ncbi:spermidine synthase [Pelomonas sp. Root1217]|uniref:spermine/spermidine synthase domain-containing protein n=1 Tax=Pelomonas sp. Root1217 TaxID=1736430 RepID=UPI00070A1CCC|nr:spermidine synthase [Pelomonas sp. Root1217]KQV58127.1 spermidine synthase [Pelomonas sp. Root1217]